MQHVQLDNIILVVAESQLHHNVPIVHLDHIVLEPLVSVNAIHVLLEHINNIWLKVHVHNVVVHMEL